ncbi:MAG: 4-hydroxythreonine-4-phosphate dehydrogenase PdxA [Pseudomonadales bacterium]|nr:4-hydroxythreonine-4-phosphate dehydrogenase PdxA [Pseudomonadales bacterium]
MKENSVIGVTLGDPAGIGPEVFARVLDEASRKCEIVVYGTRWALELGAKIAGVSLNGRYKLVDVGIDEPADFEFGVVSAVCGRIAVESVEAAAADALSGQIDAMMTCPLNKEAIHAAGYTDIGHQEILARLADVDATATMLMTPGLRVVHLSTHKSLIEAGHYVTRDNVLEKIDLCHRTMTHWGLDRIKIAVAALNPHGGEGGLLGREEIEAIEPAVEAAKKRGLDVSGPLPADSVFNRAIEGEFDAVLAMYHDQGHIAIKVHNFHESVTATLGIPFVRTSVDHGTAFDIAGRGVADSRGTKAALNMAMMLAQGALTGTT